jgi:anaerobic magnesium-protoporphyrin IX monomethyl ester cyclase
MNVLLISPPFTMYAGIKGHGGLSAPLNLGYLTSYALSKSDRFDISILDAEALEMTYGEVVEHIRKEVPALVGITTTTPSFDVVTTLCAEIRKACPEIQIVLGGPHVTALPEDALKGGSADYIVMGEGEQTFLELLNALADKTALSGIRGLAFKDKDNQVRINEPRGLIEDLDTIPMPARDKMPFHLYYSPPTKSLGLGKVVTMLTSRGCPYDCNYCVSGVMWGRGKVRYRSAKSVLDEMAYCIAKYDAHEFNFHDDLFVARKDRLIEICKGIEENRWKIGWVCMARVDFIDEERLEWMKKAGCQKIAFGIESGSELMLKRMNKKLDFARVRTAVDLCRKFRIKVGASFMIGYLDETEDTIRETIALMKEINPDTVAIFQASPYPGTEFYREAQVRGLLRKDLKWEDYALVTNSMSVVDLPNLSSDRIRYWVKRGYREFYLRPRYIIRQARNIRSMNDVWNVFMGLGILARVSGTSKGQSAGRPG